MRTIALLWLLIAGAAHAQYPAKPVRVVVGYAAGSSTDIVGRVMADRLGAYWKQNVYVETRAGAAGNLAADAVAKAPGDGGREGGAQGVLLRGEARGPPAAQGGRGGRAGGEKKGGFRRPPGGADDRRGGTPRLRGDVGAGFFRAGFAARRYGDAHCRR